MFQSLRSNSPGKAVRHGRRGWTLVEMVVTAAISTLVMASLMTVMLFSLKSFKAIGNYAEMNQSGRYALDVMNRDIRNGSGLTAGTTNNITMTNTGGDRFSYTWDPVATTLTRSFTNSAGNVAVMVLLTNCDIFSFSFYQRNPTTPPSGVSGPYFVAATNIAQTKLINVDWKCSRTIQGAKANTESVQTAQIAIRN